MTDRFCSVKVFVFNNVEKNELFDKDERPRFIRFHYCVGEFFNLVLKCWKLKNTIIKSCGFKIHYFEDTAQKKVIVTLGFDVIEPMQSISMCSLFANAQAFLRQLLELAPFTINFSQGSNIYVFTPPHIKPVPPNPAFEAPTMSRDGLYLHQVVSSEFIKHAFRQTKPDWMFQTNLPNVYMNICDKDIFNNGRSIGFVDFVCLTPPTTVFFNWALLGDQMGLGKTRTAIDVAKSFDGPILIITKTMLVGQWVDESQHVDQDLIKRCSVISHEKFRSRIHKLMNTGNCPVSPQRRTKLFKPFDPSINYELVIVDEAHGWMTESHKATPLMFKNFIVNKSPNIPKILFVTGTPPTTSYGSATQVFNMSHALDCISPWPSMSTRILKAQILNCESKQRFVRHTRESIPYMPAIAYHNVDIPYPNEMLDIIQESKHHKHSSPMSEILHQSFRLAIESGMSAKAWWMVKQKIEKRFNSEDSDCTICCCEKMDVGVLQCGHEFCHECISTWRQNHSTCPICKTRTGPPVRLEDINDGSEQEVPVFRFDSPKLNCILRLIASTQDQIIVFCERPDVCVFLRTKLGDQSVVLTGTNTQAQKEAITREFRNEKFKVLLTTLRTAAVGVNLQVARHAVFWTLFSKKSTIDQACSRLCRLGAKHSVVTCHFLRFIE
jgi:hypothetical protein